MGRLVGLFMVAALAVAPSPGMAFASAGSASASTLGALVMLRLFGEVSDVRASFSAPSGDVGDESPLRDAAFHVTVAMRPPQPVQELFVAPDDAALARMVSVGRLAAASSLDERIDRAKLTGTVRFLPVRSGGFESAGTPSPMAVTSDYQPAPTSLPISQSTSNAFSFEAPHATSEVPLTTLSSVFSPIAGFDTASESFGLQRATASQARYLQVPLALRLGNLHLQARLESAVADASKLGLLDSAYGAGANFDVRAGSRDVNVDVSSAFEHMMRNSGQQFTSANFDGTSSWEVGAYDLPILIPAYADVNKVSIGAAFAVPVAPRLMLGFGYNTEHLLGEYGMPGLDNLDARNDTYSGKLTFLFPRLSSALSFSAQQYRYEDNLVPTNTFTQLRGNVNLSVKF